MCVPSCSVLQCVAVCRSVLQWVAVGCSVARCNNTYMDVLCVYGPFDTAINFRAFLQKTLVCMAFFQKSPVYVYECFA